MDRVVSADLYRHNGLTGVAGFIKGLLTDPGFRYTYLLRKVARHGRCTPIGLFYRLLKRRHSFTYGYQIDPAVEIGEGFFLSGHRAPTVVGSARIGRNCNVNHGVTIGRAVKNGETGYPTIGDYVWIGPGSVVSGPIHVGNHVLIAPNSFVNFDVPDHSIVIGNPGRVVKTENPTVHHINHVLYE